MPGSEALQAQIGTLHGPDRDPARLGVGTQVIV